MAPAAQFGGCAVSDSKATRSIAVVNHEGFHLRAATLLVKLARQFASRIVLIKGSMQADAKTMPLQLVGLGLYQGDQVTVEAVGEDAEEAIEAIAELFASCFQEEMAQRRPVARDGVREQCLDGESSPE